MKLVEAQHLPPWQPSLAMMLEGYWTRCSDIGSQMKPHTCIHCQLPCVSLLYVQTTHCGACLVVDVNPLRHSFQALESQHDCCKKARFHNSNANCGLLMKHSGCNCTRWHNMVRLTQADAGGSHACNTIHIKSQHLHPQRPVGQGPAIFHSLDDWTITINRDTVQVFKLISVALKLISVALIIYQ